MSINSVNVEISDSRLNSNESEALILAENIKFLCQTPKGSIPLMRGFGVDFGVIDESVLKVKQRLSISIVEGVLKYFGLRISEIDISSNADGELVVNIKI